MSWRFWLGIGFVGYVVAVLVLWAFIYGATRRPTPRPPDGIDEELDRMLDDDRPPTVEVVEWLDLGGS